MHIECALEFCLGLIDHTFRGVDGPEVRIIHRERPIHFRPETLGHLNRFLHFGQRVVEPTFAEIQFPQPASSLKIVRLSAEQFFNLRDFFIGIQGLLFWIYRRAALLCAGHLCLFIHSHMSYSLGDGKD